MKKVIGFEKLYIDNNEYKFTTATTGTTTGGGISGSLYAPNSSEVSATMISGTPLTEQSMRDIINKVIDERNKMPIINPSKYFAAEPDSGQGYALGFVAVITESNKFLLETVSGNGETTKQIAARLFPGVKFEVTEIIVAPFPHARSAAGRGSPRSPVELP